MIDLDGLARKLCAERSGFDNVAIVKEIMGYTVGALSTLSNEQVINVMEAYRPMPEEEEEKEEAFTKEGAEVTIKSGEDTKKKGKRGRRGRKKAEK
jgi:hypothetical protein